MTKFLFTVITLLAGSVCPGQQIDPFSSDDSFHNRGFGMYLIFPKIELSSSELNTFLSEYNYPTLPRQTFNWGVGLQYRLGLFLLNVDAMVAHQRRENLALQTEFRRLILSTNLNLAYYVYTTEVGQVGNTFALYPFSGISTNDTNLYLSRPTQDQSIQQLLEAPGNTSQLEHFAVGINVGIGVDITRLHQEGMFLMGIRMGYRFSPEGAYAWESSFTNITNAPIDSFDHFFIQINFGGGFNWKKGQL